MAQISRSNVFNEIKNSETQTKTLLINKEGTVVDEIETCLFRELRNLR